MLRRDISLVYGKLIATDATSAVGWTSDRLDGTS